MNFNPETIWAFFGSMGLATIVVAGINAISNRKKTGADATKTLTDAAMGIVTELRSSLTDATNEVAEMKKREDERDVKDAERDRRDVIRERNLVLHHEWDVVLADVINEHLPSHVDLLPPPPLWEEDDIQDVPKHAHHIRRKGPKS
jgi:hypothetical protein